MYVIVPWLVDADFAASWVHEDLYASEDEARAEAAELNALADGWDDRPFRYLVGEVTILTPGDQGGAS